MKKTKISRLFETLKADGKKAFIPYVMAGDPNPEATLKQTLLLERCGADIIELGVPFSDPLADGPTIQKAAGRALKSGTTLAKVLFIVKEIRQHTAIPLILMTYYNPVFKYGEEKFVADAIQAGVDGVIIPDLPPEEAKRIHKTVAALCCRQTSGYYFSCGSNFNFRPNKKNIICKQRFCILCIHDRYYRDKAGVWRGT